MIRSARGTDQHDEVLNLEVYSIGFDLGIDTFEDVPDLTDEELLALVRDLEQAWTHEPVEQYLKGFQDAYIGRRAGLEV